MKYSIGDKEFKTKKESLTYARKLINDLGECIINNEHEHYKYFNDLLNNHDEIIEKIGVGIKYIFIKRNFIYGRYVLNTMIKRIDDSEIDFSWFKCSQFNTCTPEKKEKINLIRAMRTGIKKQIIKFKNKSELICVQCDDDSQPYNNYHVDHDIIEFKELTEIFLNKTTVVNT